ncbi:MAG: hypothetical protein QOI78_1509 [Actinomycetota bacterium]|nr:hypothetical protein [Actinomycetota bacterium]
MPRTQPPWYPPPDISPLLHELRNQKYTRGRGTRLSTRPALEPSGEFGVTYHHDLDPRWDPPVEIGVHEDPGFQQAPPAEDYAEELRRYPRSERRTPDWLRQGADGS